MIIHLLFKRNDLKYPKLVTIFQNILNEKYSNIWLYGLVIIVYDLIFTSWIGLINFYKYFINCFKYLKTILNIYKDLIMRVN